MSKKTGNNPTSLFLRRPPEDILNMLQEYQIEVERETRNRPSREDVLFPIMREGLEKELEKIKTGYRWVKSK